MRKILALLTFALLLALAAQPEVLHAAKAAKWKVPGDFATIQAAIDRPTRPRWRRDPRQERNTRRCGSHQASQDQRRGWRRDR